MKTEIQKGQKHVKKNRVHFSRSKRRTLVVEREAA